MSVHVDKLVSMDLSRLRRSELRQLLSDMKRLITQLELADDSQQARERLLERSDQALLQKLHVVVAAAADDDTKKDDDPVPRLRALTKRIEEELGDRSCIV